MMEERNRFHHQILLFGVKTRIEMWHRERVPDHPDVIKLIESISVNKWEWQIHGGEDSWYTFNLRGSKLYSVPSFSECGTLLDLGRGVCIKLSYNERSLLKQKWKEYGDEVRQRNERQAWQELRETVEKL